MRRGRRDSPIVGSHVSGKAGLVNGAAAGRESRGEPNGLAQRCLDYAKHRENGLRVIAVGGNSLSRGLTLEGLSTSYFFRTRRCTTPCSRWDGGSGTATGTTTSAGYG